MSKKDRYTGGRHFTDEPLRYEGQHNVVKAHTKGDRSNPAMSQIITATSSAGLLMKTRSGYKPYKSVRPISDWKGDGEDHINISWQGLTDLGNKLDFGFKQTFNHNLFYQFECLDGLRAWLRSDPTDDRFRYIFGRQLRELLGKTRTKNVKNLNAIIMDSAYQRIKQNRPLYRLMYQNELPFDSYGLYNGMLTRNRDHEWIVEGYTIIQKAIQRQEEPDFSSLADFDTNDIYAEVRSTLEVYRDENKEAIAKIEERMQSRFKPRNTEPMPPVRRDNKVHQKASVVKKTSEEFKSGKEGYVFPRNCGYSQIFPIRDLGNDTQLNYGVDFTLPIFGRDVLVNNEKLITYPVIANQWVDLLAVSHNPLHKEHGIQSNDDIIRSGPVNSYTFTEDFKTNNVLRLDSLVFSTVNNNEGTTHFENCLNLRLGLKLINKSFKKPGDIQFVSSMNIHDDETGETTKGLVIKRQVLLYKPFRHLYTENKDVKNKFIERAEYENPDHKHGIFLVDFQLLFKDNKKLYLNAKVALVGTSDDVFDNPKRKDYYFADMQDVVDELFDINDVQSTEVSDDDFIDITGISSLKSVVGYTFALFRGKMLIINETDNVVSSEVSAAEHGISIDFSGEQDMVEQDILFDSTSDQQDETNITF